jgi:hypothetical protein
VLPDGLPDILPPSIALSAQLTSAKHAACIRTMLPVGTDFVEYWDAAQDAYYYYNTFTGHSVWAKPAEFIRAQDCRELHWVGTLQCRYRYKRAARANLRAKRTSPKAVVWSDSVEWSDHRGSHKLSNAELRSKYIACVQSMLPIGTNFVEYWDAAQNAYYYYNTKTGEAVWNKPAEFVRAQECNNLRWVQTLQCRWRYKLSKRSAAAAVQQKLNLYREKLHEIFDSMAPPGVGFVTPADHARMYQSRGIEITNPAVSRHMADQWKKLDLLGIGKVTRQQYVTAAMGKAADNSSKLSPKELGELRRRPQSRSEAKAALEVEAARVRVQKTRVARAENTDMINALDAYTSTQGPAEEAPADPVPEERNGWQRPSVALAQKAAERAKFRGGRAKVWDTSVSEFVELSTGVELYFRFERYLAIWCALASVLVALPTAVLYMGGNGIPSTMRDVASINEMTLGNLGFHPDNLYPAFCTSVHPAVCDSTAAAAAAAAINGTKGDATAAAPVTLLWGREVATSTISASASALDCLGSFLYLLLCAFWWHKVQDASRTTESRSVKPSMYTVFVRGLPAEATDDQIRKHFSSRYGLLHLDEKDTSHFDDVCEGDSDSLETGVVNSGPRPRSHNRHPLRFGCWGKPTPVAEVEEAFTYLPGHGPQRVRDVSHNGGQKEFLRSWVADVSVIGKVGFEIRCYMSTANMSARIATAQANVMMHRMHVFRAQDKATHLRTNAALADSILASAKVLLERCDRNNAMIKSRQESQQKHKAANVSGGSRARAVTNGAQMYRRSKYGVHEAAEAADEAQDLAVAAEAHMDRCRGRLLRARAHWQKMRVGVRKVRAALEKRAKQRADVAKAKGVKALDPLDVCAGAFVTFNNMESRRRCLDDYRSSSNPMCRALQPRELRFQWETARFKAGIRSKSSKKLVATSLPEDSPIDMESPTNDIEIREWNSCTIRVDPAPEPSDVLWENLDVPAYEKVLHRLLSSLVSLLLIICTLSVVWAAQVQQRALTTRMQELSRCAVDVPAAYFGTYQVPDQWRIGLSAGVCPAGQYKVSYDYPLLPDVVVYKNLNSFWTAANASLALQRPAAPALSWLAAQGDKGRGLPDPQPGSNIARPYAADAQLRARNAASGVPPTLPSGSTAETFRKETDAAAANSGSGASQDNRIARSGTGVCASDCIDPADNTKCQTVACAVPEWGASFQCTSYAARVPVGCYCKQAFQDAHVKMGWWKGANFVYDNELACRPMIDETVRAVASIGGAAVFVVLSNALLQTFLAAMCRYERHESFSGYTAAVSSRVFVAQLLNTGVVVLLVNAKLPDAWRRGAVENAAIALQAVGVLDGGHADFTHEWYASVGMTVLLTMLSSGLRHLKPLLSWAALKVRQRAVIAELRIRSGGKVASKNDHSRLATSRKAISVFREKLDNVVGYQYRKSKRQVCALVEAKSGWGSAKRLEQAKRAKEAMAEATKPWLKEAREQAERDAQKGVLMSTDADGDDPFTVGWRKFYANFEYTWFTFFHGSSTQEQLNQVFAGPQFDVETAYPALLTQLFITVVLSGGLPILVPIAAINFGFSLVLDKLLLLRFYSRPVEYSPAIAQWSCRLMPVALVLRLVVSIWMHSAPQLMQSPTPESATASAAAAAASLSDTMPAAAAAAADAVKQAANWFGVGGSSVVDRVTATHVLPLVVILAVCLAVATPACLFCRLNYGCCRLMRGRSLPRHSHSAFTQAFAMAVKKGHELADDRALEGWCLQRVDSGQAPELDHGGALAKYQREESSLVWLLRRVWMVEDARIFCSKAIERNKALGAGNAFQRSSASEAARAAVLLVEPGERKMTWQALDSIHSYRVAANPTYASCLQEFNASVRSRGLHEKVRRRVICYSHRRIALCCTALLCR